MVAEIHLIAMVTPQPPSAILLLVYPDCQVMQQRGAGADRSTDRATLDVINFWCIVSLLIATVAVASVVGGAVFIGEFDEEFDETEYTDETDVGVSIVPDSAEEVTVTWTDAGDARHLEIQTPDGRNLGRLNFMGDETTVENTEFIVTAVYEDEGRQDAIVERHQPT